VIIVSQELQFLADSWKEFDLSLRMNRGLDESALESLKSALGACASAWANLDAIPRLGVNILVDIFPATESNSNSYAGEVGERIMAVAFELQELVSDCVQIDEGLL